MTLKSITREMGAVPGPCHHSWDSVRSVVRFWAAAALRSRGFTGVAGPGAWNDPDMLMVGNQVGAEAGPGPPGLGRPAAAYERCSSRVLPELPVHAFNTILGRSELPGGHATRTCSLLAMP